MEKSVKFKKSPKTGKREEEREINFARIIEKQNKQRVELNNFLASPYQKTKGRKKFQISRQRRNRKAKIDIEYAFTVSLHI